MRTSGRAARGLLAGLAMTAVFATGPAAAGIDPPVSFLANRPSVKLITDYYTYGTAPFGSDVRVRLWVDDNNIGDNLAVYLRHYDRESGTDRYFNMNPNTGALEVTTTRTPLFGTEGAPVLVPVGELDDVCLFGNGCVFGPVPSGIPTATGHYMFVWEYARENGAVISRDVAMYSFVDGVTLVPAGNVSNTNWTSNNVYVLEGATFIPNGTTLNVEPGTWILGEPIGGQVPTLGVLQGGRLVGNGTDLLPITFSSSKIRDQRVTGDIGGVAMNGFAQTNQGTSPPPEGEGNTGPYGGNDDGDSCGSLQYWRILFAGFLFNNINELNGLALQGCGSGTTLSYIEIASGQDDGIEFFGGTADADHLYLLNNEDDSLDWTFGWRGELEYACIVQSDFPPGSTRQQNDHIIEADNDGDNFDNTPRSSPTISNLTGIGLKANDTDLVRLRVGTGGNFSNFALANSTDVCLSVRDGSEQFISFNNVQCQNVDAGLTDLGATPAGVSEQSLSLAFGGSRIQPLLVPSSGNRGCDTAGTYWTGNSVFIDVDYGPES